MSAAFSSIAIALAAVASLVDNYWLLYIAWGSGGLGVFSALPASPGSISGPNGWRIFWAPDPRTV
jgi:hypothetical protein